MTWVIRGVVLVMSLGSAWVAVPTVRALVHPGFQPVSKDEHSVFHAQMTGVEHAGI
jgi:hypothetical protein